MTTLSSIVTVTITSASRGVSRASFGIPLVISRSDVLPTLFKVYDLATATIDMVTDGFLTNDPAFLAVSALARNTPKPQQVAVGKLVTDFDQTFSLTVKPVVAAGGEIYAFNFVGPLGVVSPITYTAIAADTETVIAAALETQIDAIADITSVPTAGVIAVTADVSNEMFRVQGLDVNIMEFLETTIDSNLVAELLAITAQYPAWYGLILADPNSQARAQLLAVSVEAQERIFGVTTHDTDNGESGSTTDIMFTTNAATLFRTYVLYSGDQGAHAAATWMGNRFPIPPGASTWAFKPLSGVAVDVLQTSFTDAIEAKSGNHYTALGGVNVTLQGTMASGEFIDVIRGRDWLTVRLQERIVDLLIRAPKVPFTNGGIDQVVAQVTAQMEEGIEAGYLSDDIPEGQDTAFIVTAPLASQVSSADKLNRLLPDVAFTATLAGAIHAVQISGVIQV